MGSCLWALRHLSYIEGEPRDFFSWCISRVRNGTKEGWRRLIWVGNFAELLRRCQNIDWTKLLDRAYRSRSSQSLLLAINLASTLLDAPAPTNLIARATADSAVRALSE